MIFYAIEVEAYIPNSAGLAFDLGWGAAPWGALSQLPQVVASTGMLLASDIGYRTSPADTDGPVPYPPLVSEAFSISRRVNMDPAESSIAAAWGAISLTEAGGSLDALAAAWNNDGRPCRILRGTKALDLSRGIFLDPAYTTLIPLFTGVSTAWTQADTRLNIPLRDASYWLEQPIQSVQYQGTGTYQGTANLAGTPVPKTRGAVSNVTPVLIDDVHLIYQYTDAAGTVVALYEGASANHTFQANTTNLYAGTTSAGSYRTDNSRGLFQLGSAPTANITVDCTGAFPVAGYKSVAADIARYLLAEDIALPAQFINAASFTAAAAAYPYAAGVHFSPSESPNGIVAVHRVLSGFLAKLYPARDGKLNVLSLRAASLTATPVATYSPENAVSITPVPMPSTLSPPPYRVRVAYQHCHTVQTSGYLGTATEARKAFVAAADRLAGAVSTSILLAYARPNDLAPIGGCLVNQADAAAVATAGLDLLGVRRRQYEVVLPLELGIGRELGDLVRLVWPMDDLPNGRNGIVIGEAFRSVDATITLTVLA